MIRLSSDGFIEVFCKRRREVSVKIIQRLHLLNETAADATNLDEYDELQLPKWHRDLLESRHIIAMEQCGILTPDEEASRLMNMDMLAVLGDVGRLQDEMEREHFQEMMQQAVAELQKPKEPARTPDEDVPEFG